MNQEPLPAQASERLRRTAQADGCTQADVVESLLSALPG